MSPRSKEQFEVIRQKSIEAIREAALELFAHNGYHSTSISQIAKEAGVSKGLVYNYFESKEALLQDIILDAVEMGEQFMAQLLAATDDAAEQVRMLVKASFTVVKENRRYWKLMTSLALQTDVLTEMMPMLKERQEAAFGELTGMFRKLGAEKPREMAFYFGAVLDGLLLHYMQFGEEYPIKAMEAMVLERFLPGHPQNPKDT